MIPIYLKMENFCSHESSEMNFDFNAALLIGEINSSPGQTNGAGKSVCMDALCWALTGSSKHKNSNDIIRYGTEQARVIFKFKVGPQVYKIVRTRNIANKTTVSFYRINDSKEEEIKADTNSKLNELITATTKITYDGFKNTSYFAQNSISEFMYGTSSSRQKLIAEILDLDKWNRYSEVAAVKLKEMEAELDIYKYRLSEFSAIESLQVETAKLIRSNDQEMTTLTSQQDDLKIKLDRVILNLTSFDQIKINITERNVAQKMKLSMESSLKELRSNIESVKIKITNAQLTQVAANDTLEKLEILLKETSTKLQPNPVNLNELEVKIMGGEAKFKNLQAQYKLAEAGKLCIACGYNWEHTEHKNEGLLEEKAAEIHELTKKLGEATQKLNDLRLIKKENDNLSAIITNTQNSIAKQKNIIEREEATIKHSLELENQVLRNIENSELSLRDHQAIIKKYAHIDESTDVDSIALEKRRIEGELDSLRRRTEQGLILKGSLKAKLTTLAQEKIERDTLKIKARDLAAEVGTFATLVKVFGKSGIQSVIVDNMIDELEKTANDYLNRFSNRPMWIKFITQKKDSKGALKETLDIQIITAQENTSLDSLSGGEQFRATFSIRLALSMLQAKRLGGELQLLLLDEVSSSLDKNGLDTFVSIIKQLQQSMKIMVITHDDALKEHFENIIMVKNRDGVSTIEQ